MKLKFTILAFILFSIQAYSQSKNNISFVYGTSSYDINIHGALGDFGYHPQRGNSIGLSYSRTFNNFFSIETGLHYADVNVKETSIYSSGSTTTLGNIKLISIPVIANFTFFKYLYADAGLTADFQTNYSTYSPAPNQSGIGFESGFGAKYNFGPVTIFANPFIQYHGIIHFKANQQYELYNSGIKFGAGVNF